MDQDCELNFEEVLLVEKTKKSLDSDSMDAYNLELCEYMNYLYGRI